MGACNCSTGATVAGEVVEAKSSTHTNRAFVFVKPHAVNDKVKALVRDKFDKVGISVLAEGSIAAEDIDKKRLIDTHYGAIAAKAVKQKPAELTVQPEAQKEFQALFGLSWQEALDKGLVCNCTDAVARLGTDLDGLTPKWQTAKKGVSLLKLGGGFYVGKVEGIFIVNGFYLAMRKAFTTPGSCIHYYEVEWPAERLPWADFRGKVLGGTDPKTAADGSIRKLIFEDWAKLGLQEEPSTTLNAAHASASPFEGLAERMNWLGADSSTDPFGKALLQSGVRQEQLAAWSQDPPVSFEGKSKSVFDLLEDLDTQACLDKCVRIAS